MAATPAKKRTPARKVPAPARNVPASARKAPARKPRAAPAAVKETAVAAPAEAAKPPKRKLVRDSFTIPKDEYLVLDALKVRAGKLGRLAKKSELLRAGLKALAAMPDNSLLEALAAVPPIKTGRPKAGKIPGSGT